MVYQHCEVLRAKDLRASKILICCLHTVLDSWWAHVVVAQVAHRVIVLRCMEHEELQIALSEFGTAVSNA